MRDSQPDAVFVTGKTSHVGVYFRLFNGRGPQAHTVLMSNSDGAESSVGMEEMPQAWQDDCGLFSGPLENQDKLEGI